MDLGFIRRNRTTGVDLPALLARTATAQSASPTARMQVGIETAAGHSHTEDPHVAVFSGDAVAVSGTSRLASFAELPERLFRPRQ